MLVHVRLFAMQRELAGTRALDLSLPSGATIEDAWNQVVRQHPALAPGRRALRFARNGAYAPADTPLGDGDEVFSLIRASELSPDEYITRFFDTGCENQETAG